MLEVALGDGLGLVGLSLTYLDVKRTVQSTSKTFLP